MDTLDHYCASAVENGNAKISRLPGRMADQPATPRGKPDRCKINFDRTDASRRFTPWLAPIRHTLVGDSVVLTPQCPNLVFGDSFDDLILLPLGAGTNTGDKVMCTQTRSAYSFAGQPEQPGKRLRQVIPGTGYAI